MAGPALSRGGLALLRSADLAALSLLSSQPCLNIIWEETGASKKAQLGRHLGWPASLPPALGRAPTYGHEEGKGFRAAARLGAWLGS